MTERGDARSGLPEDADEAPSGLPKGADDAPLGPSEEELEEAPGTGHEAQPGLPEPGVEPPSDA